MNKLAGIKGNWTDIKKKLKQKFDVLTESDLLYASGKQDEMLCRLEARLGITKEEVHRIISEL
jgi:uncharacterized protein YjbJ (UPF0337 family)